MARHKTINSIAHNFGDSLTSLMNYVNDDYFLSHLLIQAKETNLNRLVVDILNNKATPEELLTNPINKSIEYWTNWFPTLVESSESSMDFISSAHVSIEFDLQKTRQTKGLSRKKLIEHPYICEVIIVDDRGTKYTSKIEKWWFL